MAQLKTILERVELLNRRHELLKENDSVVAGVSGGPDSMALLFLLLTLKKKYRLKIFAAHLNHGLQKAEGKKYQALVEKTSLRLGIPFYCKSVDVRSLAKAHKRSLEEMGRIERYRFFEEVARKTRSNKIATAHTLDDQSETVLLRLLRGTGLKGLVGIPCKRKEGKFDIIRPLLSCEKNELTRFLKESKAPFLYDRTNLDTVFTRNRVRHDLIPSLEKNYNPQIKKSLANLQSICQMAQDYLDQVSADALKGCLIKKGGPRKITLKTRPLRNLHAAILSEVLFQALSKIKGNLNGLSHSHIHSVIEILHSEEDNLECHLPNFIIARKKKGILEFLSGRGD